MAEMFKFTTFDFFVNEPVGYACLIIIYKLHPAESQLLGYDFKPVRESEHACPLRLGYRYEYRKSHAFQVKLLITLVCNVLNSAMQ